MSSSAFVGRAAELAAVAAALEAASAGRSSVVWVEAAAGAGKTAFVRHVVANVARTTVVRRAGAEEIAGDVAFAMVDQFGIAHDDHPFTAGLQLLGLFAEADGSTLVVLEDLHWADPASRQALLTAVRRLDEDGVVVLATSRPPGTEDALDDGWARFVDESPSTVRLHLAPFTVDEIAELAEQSGRPISPRRAAELHEHTLGHALYVHTLLHELTADELAESGAPLPVPMTLAATSMSRLRRTSGPARELAAALAVLNRATPLVMAGSVAGVESPAAALDDLLLTGLVTWTPNAAGTPIEFAHPLYRRAVYDTLPPSLRQRLHRAAATVVQPSEALAHRAAAADGFDDTIADDLAAAAHRERAVGRLATAAAQLMSASTLTSERARREDRLLHAAQLWREDGQVGRAIAMREQLTACASSGRRSLVLGALAQHAGDNDTAWDLLSEAADDPDVGVAGPARALLGVLAGFVERPDDAMRVGEAILAMDVVDPVVERAGWRIVTVAESMSRGPRVALDRLAERLPADPLAVDPADAALLPVRGMIAAWGGLLGAPLADFRQAVAVAPHVVGARGHLHLTQLLVRAGRWDEAVAQARLARSLAVAASEVWLLAQCESTMAHLAAARGDQQLADEHLAAARRVLETVPTFEGQVTVNMTAAVIAFVRFEPAIVVERLAPISEAVAAGRINRMMPIEFWWMLLIARLNHEDVDGAAIEVERCRAAVALRGVGQPGLVADLEARLAWARRGAAGLETYAACVDVATNDPNMAALERALLIQAYGEALFLSGERRPAMEQLRQAHDLLQALGAEPFRSRVDAVLSSRGDKRVRSRAERRFTLTDRERDVAALVVTGMTNGEVAANLYVSAKAVEYHLGNIYAKLGIASRRELRQRQHELLGTGG